jgi:crotonobetainyl-CoA:carnitine CoA-transferase CaiB-like acyl-CoA transferase
MTRPLPLQGLTVVELSDEPAGELCGALLAGLGAAVTKLRSGTEDAARRMGATEAERRLLDTLVNGAKQIRSLASLEPAGAAGLLAAADVVVVGWEPGHDQPPPGFAEFDLSPAQRSERTVVCQISAFGEDGPLSGTVASDLILQAASGVMATTGEPGGGPLRAGADLGAAVGAIYGVIGICAALIERNRTGRGQVVEVAQFDCLVSTLTNFASRVLGGVPPLPRLGNQGPNTAPWNLFPTRDHQYVYIIAGSDPTFTRLSAVMGCPELATDPAFDTNEHRRQSKDVVTGLVADWAAANDAADIVRTLRENGVPVSLVATTTDALADSHFAYRELLAAEPDGDGGTRYLAGLPLGRWTFAPAPAGGGSSVPARAESVQRPRPLDGLRVVDLGTLTAGPFCCRLLANLGAEVIKVEPLAGESGRHSPPMMGDQSVYFHMTNNDKQSVSADLGTEDGRALVRRLLETADIVVENQSPGALAKRGLGATDMLEINPDLLYVSVTGYGHTGPLGGLRAYDTVIQAGAGLMSLTGEVGRTPVKTGISSADVLGALCATAGALAGMYGRQAGHHRGAAIDVALFDGIAWSTVAHWPAVLLGQPAHGQYGNGHWCDAPQGVYQAVDGPVAIAVESDEQWTALWRMLRDFDPALPEDLRSLDRAGRWQARADLDARVAAICAARGIAEIIAAGQEHRVPVGPVLEVGEALELPQVKARGLIVDLPMPGEVVMRVLNIPVRLKGTPGYVSHCAPEFASGNEALLGH